MRKFPFPRIHGPNYDLCIRFQKSTSFEQAVNNCSTGCIKKKVIEL